MLAALTGWTTAGRYPDRLSELSLTDRRYRRVMWWADGPMGSVGDWGFQWALPGCSILTRFCDFVTFLLSSSSRHDK